MRRIRQRQFRESGFGEGGFDSFGTKCVDAGKYNGIGERGIRGVK